MPVSRESETSYNKNDFSVRGKSVDSMFDRSRGLSNSEIGTVRSGSDNSRMYLDESDSFSSEGEW